LLGAIDQTEARWQMTTLSFHRTRETSFMGLLGDMDLVRDDTLDYATNSTLLPLSNLKSIP
jgi:hypothetical protein